jgi:hypothetical protein
MKEHFSLQHVVLYSKGWYKRYQNHPNSKRKTIWDDLKILLEADGYEGTFNGDTELQIKNRISYLLIIQLDRIEKTGFQGTLPDFYESIKEHNCFKFGYYTKNYNSIWKIDKSEFPDYDYNEASVRYCLSYFSRLESDKWNPIRPESKVLPLKNGISQKNIKEVFSTRPKDRNGIIIKDGDFVDVQIDGIHKVYLKEDGELYFSPYGKEDLVSSYFSSDLLKVNI